MHIQLIFEGGFEAEVEVDETLVALAGVGKANFIGRCLVPHIERYLTTKEGFNDA